MSRHPLLTPRHIGATAILSLTFGMLAGCPAQQKLQIVAEPSGSIITVNDTTGRQVVSAHATPVELLVKFTNSGGAYKVRVQPTKAQADRYIDAEEEVNHERYSFLPEVRSRVRKLTVRLQPKPYEQIRVIKLKLDPQQGWVGFVTEERAFREVTEQGGAVPTRVVEFGSGNVGITGLALDPDGKRIVFSSTTYEIENLELIKELRLDEHRELPLRHANLQGVRITGGGVQHITSENFQDMFPSFTADSRFLLFCSNRRRASSTDILRTNADGRGGIANIYVDQRSARAVKPSQAKDGTTAFALYPPGWSQPGDVQVWTIGGPNEFPTQITLGMQPQISPDGKYIAYIGQDGNLWAVQSDGRDATQLTSGADKILERFKKSLRGVELKQFEVYETRRTLLRHYRPFSYPSWSPDGLRILYSSMEGNDPTGRPNEDIWIMSREGTGKQQLTTNGSVDRFPLMSPDGRWLYFMSNRGLKWAIWRIAPPAAGR